MRIGTKSNSFLKRITLLEKELGIIQESFDSTIELKQFLMQKGVLKKVKEIQDDPQRFNKSGYGILKFLDLEDPRFIDDNEFLDIYEVLGSFVYSGFCCDFSSDSIHFTEFKNKKFPHVPWDEIGIFYLTSVNRKEFNGIEQFLKLNFDSINALESLEQYVTGDVSLRGRSVIIKGDLNFSGKLRNFKNIRSYLDSLKIKNILEVTGNVDISNNNFSNLSGIPLKIEGDLDISHNNISDFKYYKKDLQNVGGDFICDFNPIESWGDLPLNLANTLELKLASIFESDRVEIEGRTVNVFGDVNLKRKLGSYKSVHDYLKSEFNLDKFGTVTREIDISHNSLNTLYGCPRICKRINAGGNNLVDLKYCPEVGQQGELTLYSNSLTSLKGIKDDVVRQLNVMDNKLKNLDFIPKKISYMVSVSDNPGLDGSGFSEDYVLSKTISEYVR